MQQYQYIFCLYEIYEAGLPSTLDIKWYFLKWKSYQKTAVQNHFLMLHQFLSFTYEVIFGKLSRVGTNQTFHLRKKNFVK